MQQQALIRAGKTSYIVYMGDYFSKTTTTDGVMDNQPVIAKARIVEHIVAKYEEVDNPETHVPYAKVPDEFCLKPKYERGMIKLEKLSMQPVR